MVNTSRPEMTLGGRIAQLRIEGGYDSFELSKQLGFSSLKSAQRSPVALLGTVEQVTEEIRQRQQNIGMTYYIFVNGTKQTQNLFVKHIMPYFA